MATKEGRKLTAEFKRQVVKLRSNRDGPSAVARELGVERSVLKRQVKNFAAWRYDKAEAATEVRAVAGNGAAVAGAGEGRDGARHPKKSPASSRKSRREVCLCRPLSAGVADPGHVSAAGGVGERILRMVGPAAKRAVAGERTLVGAHSGKLRLERPDLRLAADLEGYG